MNDAGPRDLEQAKQTPKEPDHPGFEVYKSIEFPITVVVIIHADSNAVRRYEIQDAHEQTIFTTKDAKEAADMEKLLNFLNLKTAQLQNSVIELMSRLQDAQASIQGQNRRQKKDPAA